MCFKVPIVVWVGLNIRHIHILYPDSETTYQVSNESDKNAGWTELKF